MKTATQPKRNTPPNRWYLRDWKIERLKAFKGLAEIIDLRGRFPGVGQIGDYFLRLDQEHGYRRFLITDNGGELNIHEIGGQMNEASMPLPVNGSYAETNVSVVYYRLMQWINGEEIDYHHKDDSLTEEDFETLTTTAPP